MVVGRGRGWLWVGEVWEWVGEGMVVGRGGRGGCDRGVTMVIEVIYADLFQGLSRNTHRKLRFEPTVLVIDGESNWG